MIKIGIYSSQNIMKPFSTREVVARIKTILRRVDNAVEVELYINRSLFKVEYYIITK